MKKIEACWVTLNRSCNLRCSFCYTNDLGFKKEDTMTMENFAKIIEFCKQGNIKHVTLIGGEPTVYQDLCECISLLIQNDFTFTIVTNGILLNNDNYFNRLLEAGLKKSSMVSISVKETDEDLYEQVTGARAYERTLNAFKRLKEYNIPSSFSFVITPENVERYLEGLKPFIAISGNYYVGLSICYDFNQSTTKDPNYLDKNDYFDLIHRFIKSIPELNRITEGRWNLQNGIPRCLMDDEEYEVIREHSTVGCQLIDGWGIVFDTDLSLIPCNSTFDTKLGKLGKDFNSYEEFVKLFDEGMPNIILKHLRSLPHPFCAGCKLLKSCKGGCLAYWSQFSFDEAMKFKYIHNFSKLFKSHEKELPIIGTHGTTLCKCLAILQNGRISSTYNKELNGKYNFAFYFKPAYKDYKRPYMLEYIVSEYQENEITNIFPFDSGYYSNKIFGKKSSIHLVNYWIPVTYLGDFISKIFINLPNYYNGNFNYIPTNAVLNNLFKLYKSCRPLGNPDERGKTIEISCLNDHLINANNTLCVLAPTYSLKYLKGQKIKVITYSHYAPNCSNAEVMLQRYFIKKGLL